MWLVERLAEGHILSYFCIGAWNDGSKLNGISISHMNFLKERLVEHRKNEQWGKSSSFLLLFLWYTLHNFEVLTCCIVLSGYKTPMTHWLRFLWQCDNYNFLTKEHFFFKKIRTVSFIEVKVKWSEKQLKQNGLYQVKVRFDGRRFRVS